MDITRKRGDTYPDVVTIKNRATRAVVNLTGCTFILTVSTSSSPTDTSTKLYDIAGVVDAPATGIVEFSPTLSNSDRVGYFYYDIQMTDSFGDIHTLVSGSYAYIQDITK